MKRRPLLVVDDLPLNALEPIDALSYVSAWRPPTSDRDRALSKWATWDAYLKTWTRVERAWRASSLPQENLFVERVLRYRARHGSEALDRASFEDLQGA